MLEGASQCRWRGTSVAAGLVEVGAELTEVGAGQLPVEVPEVASTTYLPQIVGLQNALDLILTGRTIDAQEALSMGLVKAVVPGERLLEEALTFAGEIANNPTDQVVVAKQMVHKHMVQPDIDSVVAEENRNIVHAYKGTAHKEAVTAFLEKRQPRFNG